MKKSLIFLLILTIFISSCTTGQVTTEIKEAKLEGPYLVTYVVDGDTADVNISGNIERIRFSGINTPEKKECYYQEAKDRLKELILDKKVYIQKDISDRGKYGRLLRYVYENNTLINQLLVEEGYARVYHKYRNDTSKYYQLARTESIAIQNNIGLWKNCPEK